MYCPISAYPRTSNTFHKKAKHDPDDDFFQTLLLQSIEDSDFAIVAIKCGDAKFNCTRGILTSRSSYFKAMLENKNFKERRQDSVEINNYSEHTMRTFLHVMLTNQACEPESLDEALDLLQASDEFEFQFLKEEVVSWILSKMTFDVAPTILGWFLSCQVDKSNCNCVRRLIKKNINELLTTEAFQKLVAKHPAAFREEKNQD